MILHVRSKKKKKLERFYGGFGVFKVFCGVLGLFFAKKVNGNRKSIYLKRTVYAREFERRVLINWCYYHTLILIGKDL